MSPIYEYRCPHGHTTQRLRKYEKRDEPVACAGCIVASGECGVPMGRIFSAHHAPPDGIYSYCPNIGDPEKHARRDEQIAKRREAAKHGERISPVVDAE